jgi:hypothetical protein
MIIAAGTLKTFKGADMSIAAIAADYAKGHERLMAEIRYWTYDVVGRDFVAIPLDKIFSQDSTARIFEVKTATGKVLLPEGGKLLKSQHGIETTASVAGMHMFHNWANGTAVRVKFNGNGEPEKYEEEMVSVFDLGDPASLPDGYKPKTEEEQEKDQPVQYPVFEVGGAAGIARLLVVDGFLVG